MVDLIARRSRDETGLSLVELLVVMAVTVVIGSAILATVAGAARAERLGLDLRENTDRARLAVERVRDVVREAYSVCDGSDATTLRLWTGDAAASDNHRVDEAEVVTFQLASGELRRQDGTGSPRVIAFGLGAESAFAYVDRDGNSLDEVIDGGVPCPSTDVIAGRGDVSTISVRLAGVRDPGGPSAGTVVDTSMTLRNAAMLDGTINPNRPPVALFSATCSDRSCEFNAHASYDEDGDIVSYAWEFEGATHEGGTATTATPVIQRTYVSYGSSRVSLTVQDNEGGTATTTRWINLLEDGDPAAAFTVSCPSLTCNFDASPSLVGGASPDTFLWDLGDGETATGLKVSHTYSTPGSVPVTLTVVDGAREAQAIDWANPTDQPDVVRIELIEDISSSLGGSGNWVPKVKIRVVYPDGAPAHRVTVHGKFGPSPEVANDLKSNTTNSLGEVSLQANGSTNTATFHFEVTAVGGKSIDSTGSTMLSLTLTRPGS